MLHSLFTSNNTFHLLCLKVVGKNKEEVDFGSEGFFGDIIQPDESGNDYEAQRKAWREGTDFKFVAEFYAKIVPDEGEQSVEVPTRTGGVIETTAEEV